MTRPLQMTCGASWVSAQLGYTPPPQPALTPTATPASPWVMPLQSPSTSVPSQPLEPSRGEGERGTAKPRAAGGAGPRTASPAHLLPDARAVPRRWPARALRTEHCSLLSTPLPHGSRIRDSKTS